MEIPIDKRKEVIDRAGYLMKKYGYDPLTALKITEQEIENQKKKDKLGEKNYD